MVLSPLGLQGTPSFSGPLHRHVELLLEVIQPLLGLEEILLLDEDARNVSLLLFPYLRLHALELLPRILSRALLLPLPSTGYLREVLSEAGQALLFKIELFASLQVQLTVP